jgi:hypothetical protein
MEIISGNARESVFTEKFEGFEQRVKYALGCVLPDSRRYAPDP